MASPFGLFRVRPGGSLLPGRLEYHHRSPSHMMVKGPDLPSYLAVKPLYQKFFGGNWVGVLYTLACQSASE
jgi:hypothetical protein